MLTEAALVFGLTLLLGAARSDDRPALVPIPSRPFGVVLGSGAPTARIQLEVFLELLCDDSRQTWRVVKELATHYDANDVRIVIHQFPMPYHRNGFMVTQSLFELQDLRPEKLPQFIEFMFRNMERFSVAEHDIRYMLASALSNLTGFSSAEILARYDRYYSITKAAWKFGARRGVAGAPWYFINGVELSKSAEPMTVQEMRALLDRLLRTSTRPARLQRIRVPRHADDQPSMLATVRDATGAGVASLPLPLSLLLCVVLSSLLLAI